MSRQNPARMVVHLTTPAADVPAVIQIRHTATVILVRADIRHHVLTDTAVHLIKDVPAVYKAVLNVINVMLAQVAVEQQYDGDNTLNRMKQDRSVGSRNLIQMAVRKGSLCEYTKLRFTA